ncbi:permease [Humidisolicoccus flavus]|uniref:permease n=1 Tax=Humidisolicoccus flavus TaxID=3111414 RepID=UPI003248298A
MTKPPARSASRARVSRSQAHHHGHLHPSGTAQSRGGRIALWSMLLAFITLLGASLALRVTSPDVSAIALFQDAVTLASGVIIESFPFIVLGITLSVIVQVWLPEGLLFKLLPKRRALRRGVLSTLGILLPVCECGNVPLSRGLLQRGLRPSEAITFLLAAPIVNPVTIVTTFQAFGFDHGILFARILGGLVIANLVGWIFDQHPNQNSRLTPSFQATCEHARHAPRSNGARAKAAASVQLFIDESRALLPALFLGGAIAGIIQVAISRDLLTTLGQHPIYSILAMMALAFIVSLCSSVDAFFALALASLFMPGALLAFLLFGPLIDLKMIALFRTTFTTRTIIELTVIIALLVAVLALGLNLVS